VPAGGSCRHSLAHPTPRPSPAVWCAGRNDTLPYPAPPWPAPEAHTGRWEPPRARGLASPRHMQSTTTDAMDTRSPPAEAAEARSPDAAPAWEHLLIQAPGRAPPAQACAPRPQRRLPQGAGGADGQGAPVVRHAVADSEGDGAVRAVVDRSTGGVRHAGRFGAAVPGRCEPAPGRRGPWMPRSLHALQGPAYRLALREGSVPTPRAGSKAVFPWRQGMSYTDGIASGALSALWADSSRL
jgi:hypothetical protein